MAALLWLRTSVGMCSASCLHYYLRYGCFWLPSPPWRAQQQHQQRQQYQYQYQQQQQEEEEEEREEQRRPPLISAY